MSNNNGVLTGTAAALGSVTGVAGKGIIIKVVTSGTETISVTGLISGTTASAAMMFKNLATAVAHSGTAMDDGTYYLEKIYTDTLIFTGSGSSDTKTVTYRIVDNL